MSEPMFCIVITAHPTLPLNNKHATTIQHYILQFRRHIKIKCSQHFEPKPHIPLALNYWSSPPE